MAAAKKIRLFKIASEINIGKDTIVEFLQGKGFDIHNKPTAFLTEEMLDAIYEKFKREKRAALKQREKVQKHKETRRPAGKSKADEGEEEETSVQVQADPVVEKTDTKEELVEKVTPQETAPVEMNSEKEEDNGVKPGTVIDLPPDGKSIFDAKKEEEKSKKTSRPRKPQLEEKEVEEKPMVKEQVAPVVEKKVVKPAPKPVVTKEVTTVVEKVEKTIVKETIAEEVAKPAPKPVKEEVVSETVTLMDDEEIDPDNPQKKRKKRKNIIEVEPGSAPKLKGLTVLGKIDINAGKPKKVKKPERKKKDFAPSDGSTGQSSAPKHVHVKKKRIPLDRASAPTGNTIDAASKAKNAANASSDKKQPNRNAKPNQPQTGGPGNRPANAGAPAKPANANANASKHKKKRRKSIREMINQEDVDKAVKATLAGMGGGSAASNRQKMRQKKKADREVKELHIQEEKEKDLELLELTEFVTTSDLANLMKVNVNDVILKCMELGLMVTINQRLDKETITLIALDYDFEAKFFDEKAVQFIEEEEEDDALLEPRWPIVTIMGHVDHGKTSLLDNIRNANVVAGEAGGITQHIGAYQVELKGGKKITFLDTPGHEAFTAMRARGAQVTDIVVLVVAADDSVMPQTIEAISHAKAAEVPIVVAINKCDKPDAKPERIKQQLADHSVLVEEWGGSVQFVEISAKQGINIDSLLEKILLEAEMLELKANPNRNGRGVVVEANMSKGLGAVATIIVQKGTLKVGDPFVSGVFSGRVRVMLDERGNKVKEVGPSDPVMVIGYDGLPEAGDGFIQCQTDSEARNIANERKQLRREQELRQVHHVTLDEISAQIQIGGVQDLCLLVKGDVSGSVEAISDSLLKLSNDEVKVQILHKGVGAISETDVMLAAASKAVIIGFNVNPTSKARKAAELEKVDIRNYSIIYDCINEIQLALEGMLRPEVSEEIICSIEVRKVFKISRLGAIAGCYIQTGKITRNDSIRLLRDGFEIFKGGISSLKRGKDDVREVDHKYECGIQLDGYNDLREGDIIEGYKMVETKRTLKKS